MPDDVTKAEGAARQAQDLLQRATTAGNDRAATLVDIANGWTRLYAALANNPVQHADMTIREETFNGVETVVVPEKAVEMLTALGWTPPGDEPATITLPPLEGTLPVVALYQHRFQVLGWDFDRYDPNGPKVTLRLGRPADAR